ncbi:MAG TPA: SAM-dependent methyltransferase [Acidobacteriota bacterium]|nr:SAM-dependent methyltransferase [Acidobacteriota bacterium]
MNAPQEPAAPTPIERIALRRAAAAPLTFADFMALALYHPEHGYYTRRAATTGREGDFSTSSDVSPAFGRRLAAQAIDVWKLLGGGPWRIVELGPGRGLLAADLFAALREFEPAAAAALEEYALVEISPSLEAAQRERLAPFAAATRFRWARAVEELGEGSVVGFVYGNEFLDAFPAHAIARRGAELVERGVAPAGADEGSARGAADGATEDVGNDDAGGLEAERNAPRDGAESRLRFVDLPLSSPRLAELAARYGLCAEDGWEAEIALGVEAFAAALGRVLARGAACFVDYGHPAARLADENHREGSLVGYFRHRVTFDLLARPGLQDLTAHVNWDFLDDAMRDAGMVRAGRAAQDKFLLALGAIEDLAAPEEPERESPERLALRLAARSLILPGAGGGARFEAALYVKGIPTTLRGLADPFAGL